MAWPELLLLLTINLFCPLCSFPAEIVSPDILVTMATGVTQCRPGEYLSDKLCCRGCPAGHHVSKPCNQDHGASECAPCGPRTYLAHPNCELSCLPCSQCREDQEVVATCSPTADQRCQCKRGRFYCDSEDCVESCFRCSRCPKDRAVLKPCNATANTVCARADPGPGTSWWYWLLIPLALAAVAAGVITVFCCRRRACASEPPDPLGRCSLTGIKANSSAVNLLSHGTGNRQE